MLFTGRRITGNAEVKELQNDRKVTNFTVALNTRFKTKAGEKKEKTAFVDCSYWVNPGLTIYLTKGAIVEINGWVDAEAYLSNKDQTAKSRLVCSVDKIKLFSSLSTATRTESEPEKMENNPPYTTGAGADDDLPF